MYSRMIKGSGGVLVSRAFTLVELLVVISIVGLLSALAFPAFKGAYTKARSDVCVNNLRQLSVAINLYTADNDGRLPASYVVGSNGADNNWWYNVNPYTNAKRMTASWDSIRLRSMEPPYHCPETTGTEAGLQFNAWVSYKMSMKFRLTYAGSALNVTTGMPRVRVSDHSKIILLTEGRVTPEFSEYTTTSAATGVRYPHAGKLNGLFMDGHIETFRQEDLKARWSECYPTNLY